MQYIYAKDKFLPADAGFITADDRSFRFGDGIFETMLIAGGRLYDAPAHFTRLAEGLKYFRLDLDISGLEGVCRELMSRNHCASGYVRIVVSRGDSAGLVGYMPGEAKPYMVVQTVEKPFPAYKPLSLAVSKERAHMVTPCKTNNALIYTMAMMEARDHGCDNALMLDTRDLVCETATGNIFWVKDNVLYTPELGLPFVPGTVRKKIIELSPLPVKEGRYTLLDIAQADEIFMTNVGTLVAPISTIKPLGYVSKKYDKIQIFRNSLERDINS